MKKTYLFGIGGGALILIVGAMQFLSPSGATPFEPAPFQLLPEENNTATTSNSQSTQTNSPVSAPSLPSIASGDTIASWDFKGVYLGNPELVAKAESEIKRLSSLFGEGYPDVTLYVGIAGQYELLGNGKQAYDYLSRAIEASDGTSGLPWHNIGVLMERLRAFNTARAAYEKSTLVQPGLKQWHYAYLEFLTSRMGGEVSGIEKAFAAAERNIGQDPYLSQLRAEWQGS